MVNEISKSSRKQSRNRRIWGQNNLMCHIILWSCLSVCLWRVYLSLLARPQCAFCIESDIEKKPFLVLHITARAQHWKSTERVRDQSKAAAIVASCSEDSAITPHALCSCCRETCSSLHHSKCGEMCYRWVSLWLWGGMNAHGKPWTVENRIRFSLEVGREKQRWFRRFQC